METAMAVLAEKPHGSTPTGSRIPGTDRASAELFARVFEAYKTASQTVKDIVATMSDIINDSSADREEVDAAVDTLIEALFPGTKDGGYGADLDSLKAGDGVDARPVLVTHQQQEEHFSVAVKALMAKKGMTQQELAQAVGVTQPAIALLLSRKCRPQKATVKKIAAALQVDPEEIWHA
jgi:DNA-binding XRE family transcriptional regulator